MSGVGSWALGERTESPTAMMRIAKIAGEVEGGVEGGGNPGWLAAATGSAESGDESLRRRGPGGSLRGRGGDAIGRSAFALALPAAASAAESVGSEGVRPLLDAFGSLLSGIEGFERRRIGGG